MNDIRYIEIMISSFAGALFAFLFIRVSEYLYAYYERSKRNYSALVKLRQALNDIMEDISNNQFTNESFIERFNNFFENHTKVPVSIDKYCQVRYTPDIVTELLDTNHMNEISKLFYKINKLNLTLEDINTHKNSINDSIIKQVGHLGEKVLVDIDAMKVFHTQNKLLLGFIKEIERDAVNLLAANELLCKRDIPLFHKLVVLLYEMRRTKNFKTMQQLIAEKYQKEKRIAYEKRKKEIDKITDEQKA